MIAVLILHFINKKDASNLIKNAVIMGEKGTLLMLQTQNAFYLKQK